MQGFNPVTIVYTTCSTRVIHIFEMLRFVRVSSLVGRYFYDLYWYIGIW